MDGLVNWEGSQTDDAERFSQNSNNDSDGKNLKSFQNNNSHIFFELLKT